MPKVIESDLDGIHNFDRPKNISNDDYYIIVYKKRINGKLLKLSSQKIYADLDYIRMKIYLNGFLALRHNSTFSSYSFDLSILHN
ncbi:MAG: hypothetical protein QM535_21575 [Limnohabitans sp.]|nr:hypothetical protein [Limnohabitans sp.]